MALRTIPPAGVYFTLKEDGTLDFWDLVQRHTDPVLTLQVSDSPLTAMTMTETGKVG